MEIVPEIGRATSKPLKITIVYIALKVSKVHYLHENLTLIVASKSPRCVSNELLGISSISISSKGKIAKGEFYF